MVLLAILLSLSFATPFGLRVVPLLHIVPRYTARLLPEENWWKAWRWAEAPASEYPRRYSIGALRRRAWWCTWAPDYQEENDRNSRAVNGGGYLKPRVWNICSEAFSFWEHKINSIKDKGRGKTYRNLFRMSRFYFYRENFFRLPPKTSFLGKIIVAPSWLEKCWTLYWLGE